MDLKQLDHEGADQKWREWLREITTADGWRHMEDVLVLLDEDETQSECLCFYIQPDYLSAAGRRWNKIMSQSWDIDKKDSWIPFAANWILHILACCFALNWRGREICQPFSLTELWIYCMCWWKYWSSSEGWNNSTDEFCCLSHTKFNFKWILEKEHPIYSLFQSRLRAVWQYVSWWVTHLRRRL